MCDSWCQQALIHTELLVWGVIMPENRVSTVYKWLEFCARVVTRFTWCSKILIVNHVEKFQISWKRSLGNISWNQGQYCDAVVYQ